MLQNRTSNIVSAIQHLKLSYEYMADFERQHPHTIGQRLFKRYRTTIERMVVDFYTNPSFDNTIREGVKAEWNSDVFALPAIMDKVSLLSPEKREALEFVIDQLLKGEDLIVEHIKGDETTLVASV